MLSVVCVHRRCTSQRDMSADADGIRNICKCHFHNDSNASFLSNVGLTMGELLHIWNECAKRLGTTPKELIMSQHFAWRYPQGEAGASTFKMCRQTHQEKAWKGVCLLEAHMNEMKMSNRKSNMLRIDGPAAHCSLHADSSDFLVSRPSDSKAQKHWWTFKNGKFGMRCAMACSGETGDLCWVSCGHPAGSMSDLNVNREGGFLAELDFFERVGADGAHVCRRDPQCRCPHRKPRGGSLTEEQMQDNNAFGNHRSIVENTFSRVKQFACMRGWRHKRDQHPTIARCCFQVTQVKNLFRPVRAIEHSHTRLADIAASWRAAEAKGEAPVMSPPKKRRRSQRRREAVEADDTDSDGDDDAPGGLAAEQLAVNARNEAWERDLRSAAQAGERADRAARRAARRTDNA